MSETEANATSRRDVLAAGALLAAATAAPGPVVAQQGTGPVGANPEAGTLPQPTGALAGKVALVTGGARGIGAATALALAREGADVVLFDVADPNPFGGRLGYPLASREDLEASRRAVEATGRRALAIRGDVRDSTAVRSAVERTIRELGQLDVAVANAGILPRLPLTQVTDEVWADVIGTNLTGVGNVFRAAAPHMIERRQGRLIAVASEHGRIGSYQRHVYTASKWGVIGFVKSTALELAEHNVTANAVNPGFTRTGMAQNPVQYRALAHSDPNPTWESVQPAIKAIRDREHLIGDTIMEPEEIAGAVLYLASDAARRVTGVALDVTGGENAHVTA